MENNYQKARKMIKEAKSILITASNGLSISEGYALFAENEDFQRYFGRWGRKYGFTNIISGVYTPMEEKDREAFKLALQQYFIEDYKPSSSYQNLLSLVRNKDYFILTSNADKHFVLNGFGKERLFEIEGNFFDEREGDRNYTQQYQNYLAFMEKADKEKLLVWELGIGKANQLIKRPMMEEIDRHPDWSYLTMNLEKELNIPSSIQSQSLGLKGDIRENLSILTEEN